MVKDTEKTNIPIKIEARAKLKLFIAEERLKNYTSAVDLLIDSYRKVKALNVDSDSNI